MEDEDSPVREAPIIRATQVALSKLGARVFRNNVGALQDKVGRWVQYGLCKGSCDLIGLSHNGRFIAIEIKAGNTATTDEQHAFIEMVNRMGGVAFIARSAEEAVMMYHKLA